MPSVPQPRALPPVPAGTLHRASSDADKLRKSLTIIEAKIVKGAMDPRARALALQIVRSVPERDELGEVKALARYVKSKMPFRRDIYQVETLADWDDSLRLGGGDCDDYTITFGAMARALGYPVRVRIVGVSQFSHIMPEVYLRKERRWLPVDLTQKSGKWFKRTGRFPRDRRITVNPRPPIRRRVPPVSILAPGPAASAPSPPPTVPGVALAPPAPEPRFQIAEDRLLADMDSWLSELGKKVLGKKRGKKLEQNVNANFRAATGAVKTLAPIVPVVGPVIAAGAQAAEDMTSWGADPRKVSKKTIAEMSTYDPVTAANLAQIKAYNIPGYSYTPSSGLTVNPTWTAAGLTPAPVPSPNSGLLLPAALAAAALFLL